MNLREFLAVEVMGWTKGRLTMPHSGTFYIPPDRSDIIIDWRPDELIEQAIMCAEKHGSYAFYKADEIYCDDEYEYTAEVTPSEWGMVARGKTLAEAVSLAVARAAGWKDDS